MTERRAVLALAGAGLAAVALGALRAPRAARPSAAGAAPARRILSLAVTADEILAPLVGASRLAAVTRFADDPFISTAAGAIAATVPRVSAHDPEALLALDPDLAIVAHFTLQSAVRLLEATGTAVVRLSATRSFDDVEQNLLRVGRAVGELSRAELLARELKSRLAAVGAQVADLPAPRVLYYSPVGYTAGAGTLVDAKLTVAGARNVAREAGLVGFRSVALELLAALDPEVILVPRWSPDAVAPVAEVTRTPAFAATRAVTAGRVLAVDARDLTSESPAGIRGVEVLAARLHQREGAT